MTDKELRYFVAVVDHKSYTKAAKSLYISQPSLSQAISRLEMSVGKALLKRTSVGVVYTEAGKQLYATATKILTLWSAFQESIHEMHTLLIGAPVYTYMRLSQNFHTILSQQLPGVECKIICDDGSDLEEMLLANDIDIAILWTSKFLQKPNISYYKIYKDPIVAVIPISIADVLPIAYADSGKATLDVSLVRDVPLLRCSDVCRTDNILDYYFEPLYTSLDSHIIIIDNYYSLIEEALTKNAVVLLPHSMCRKFDGAIICTITGDFSAAYRSLCVAVQNCVSDQSCYRSLAAALAESIDFSNIQLPIFRSGD